MTKTVKSKKLIRQLKTITTCDDAPILSGPGAWHVAECDCCHNITQVAQWQEKCGDVVTLCQLCFD